MSTARKIAGIAGSVLLFWIGFDVVGVIGSLFFDVAPLRGKSGALFYAIWFVLGVFAGLLGYNSAGSRTSPTSDKDWTNGPDASATGLLVIAVTSVLLAVLLALGYLFLWRMGSEPSFYVPDSMPLTLTYLITALAATILGHTVLRPAPEPPTS